MDRLGDFLTGPWGLPVVIGLCFLASFVLLWMLLGTGTRLRREREQASRLKALAQPGESVLADANAVLAADETNPFVGAADRFGKLGGIGLKLELRLDQAGLPMKSGEYLLMVVGACFGGGVIGALLLTNIAFILILAVVGAVIPFIVLSGLARRRRSRVHDQLPDLLTTLASSLRAGHSFAQGLDSVAKEATEPAATEFARVVSEIRLGRPVDDALDALADRIDSQDLRWALLAINIHRETGGNLAEVLDTVAETIRERDAVRRQVEVLTVEGKLSMYILTVLPVLIGLWIFVRNRAYLQLLVTTSVGRVMSIGAVALIGIGFIWMRKVVKLDV